MSALPDHDTAGYRAVLHRLAGLDAEAAADRAEATGWHDARVAAADAAVHTAEEEVRESERALRAARREREEVDARAAQIWSDYVHAAGTSVERYGRTPPEPSVPRQRDREADEYLQEAAATIKQEPPRRPLNGATTVMFAAFGFMGGALGAAAYQVLRWAGRTAGDDWAVGLPVLALLALLLGPVLATFGAKRVADRRGVGLDATAVLTVLITGLLTAGLLYTALGGGASPA
ncbi:MAG TPA: hypothetical protein VFH03_22755 [Actinoplanes sp.]|nr:hypothetical protein [Actinoplanes sp.]